MAISDDILFVHHAGRTTAFAQADVESVSRFGGTIDHRLFGAPFGPRRLHQVGFVAFADLELPTLKPFAGLPLIYGLNFDGCDLSYRVAEAVVDIEYITPDRSADDWPYEGYPSELPAVPLIAKTALRQSWEDFRELVPNWNERETQDVTIVVPPPANLGFSLWGPMGDANGVTIVFQYALASDKVRAFNVCG
jgi:hypothetical protein